MVHRIVLRQIVPLCIVLLRDVPKVDVPRVDILTVDVPRTVLEPAGWADPSL